jgi:hypothetical protein
MTMRFLNFLALWACCAAGSATVANAQSTDNDAQRRFKGIGLVLVEDAVRGAELRQVSFYDDRGVKILAPSLVSIRNKKTFAISSGRVPLTMRVLWREGAGWDDMKKVWNEGTIVGDYTIPVAERIPDHVLDEIRASGGALRLKFRLKPDGVLFGWDIERDGAGAGRVTKYDLPGGDFKEARIYNGKPVEPGWQVSADGGKMVVDY